jgi:hypothetical protein
VTLPLALRILAWLLLAGLVIVTIGPIQWRPISPLPTQLERAVALMLVGFVFALAYPRRIVLVAVLLVAAVGLLELLQVLQPSRHGRVLDFLVKAVGALVGLGLGRLLGRRDR